MQVFHISNSYNGSQRRKTHSVRHCEPCCLAKQYALVSKDCFAMQVFHISNSYNGSQRRTNFRKSLLTKLILRTSLRALLLGEAICPYQFLISSHKSSHLGFIVFIKNSFCFRFPPFIRFSSSIAASMDS